MKTRVDAIGVLASVMCLAATLAVAAPSGDAGCASAGISIRTGMEAVPAGTTLGIAGSVNNCSSRKTRYTVVLSGLSSCGQKVDIATGRMSFTPGENKMFTYSYPLPANTCAGTWQATVQVLDNSGMVATASTSLTVQ